MARGDGKNSTTARDGDKLYPRHGRKYIFAL